MTSTQPMAPKPAKSLRPPSSSSPPEEEEEEEEEPSCISVDSSSSVTNRLRSAHCASHACRSASESRGSLSLAAGEGEEGQGRGWWSRW